MVDMQEHYSHCETIHFLYLSNIFVKPNAMTFKPHLSHTFVRLGTLCQCCLCLLFYVANHNIVGLVMDFSNIL